MYRRTFLATTVALTSTVIAGCLGGGPSGEQSPTPSPTATATPGQVAAQEKFPDYQWDKLSDVAPTATNSIDMVGTSYDPLVAAVAPGTTITWTNTASFAHTLTIPKLGVDESVAPDTTVKVTFDESGTLDYVCTIHPPGMLGRVVVSETTPSPTMTPTPSPSPEQQKGSIVEAINIEFNPVRLSVDPGTTVEWVNKESGAYATSHTVTSATFHDKATQWSFDQRIAPDERVSNTFEEAGVYEYLCSIHGKTSMCGVVLVGDVSLEANLPCE